MLFQITCKYTLDEQNYLKAYLLKKLVKTDTIIIKK